MNAPPPATSSWTTLAPADEPDESIVRRVVAGEVALFEVLMRRHNRRVFRTARAILKNDDDAEDAMQEAYVSAYQHLADFRGGAKFSTWLVRIAVHAALGKIRKDKRVARLSDLDDADGDGAAAAALEEGEMKARSPEDEASDAELRPVLERAVDALPATFRAVFVMRAVEEMSVAETAEALEIPEETVRTRLHRARGMLRADLAHELDTRAVQTFDFHLSRCDRVVASVLRCILGRDGTT